MGTLGLAMPSMVIEGLLKPKPGGSLNGSSRNPVVRDFHF